MKRNRNVAAREAAAQKLFAIADDFLSQFPAEERSRRIRNFSKTIASLRKKKRSLISQYD
jgi:hypothetical protein